MGQRTVQRWRVRAELSDGRKGPLTKPHNKLSDEEIKKMLEVVTSVEFINKSPHQIVPALADRGEFIASESSFYRMMKTNALLTHRGSVKPKTMVRPRAFEATNPNELYSWDITYLRSSLRGQYFYLYLFIDIFSRKIVGWRVHDRESAELAAELLNDICLKEGIAKDTLVLHSDNGGPMKGATMLITLQRLGIVPSFSRPSVSDDNAFSESTFRTLKHCPQYPTKPFESLEAATEWVEKFVIWYNTEHLHSGISFVTPTSRHEGDDVAILEKRKSVYTEAKTKNPSRWSKEIRNWNRINSVKLNSLKEENKSVTTEDSRLVS